MKSKGRPANQARIEPVWEIQHTMKPVSTKPHSYSYNTTDCAMTKKNTPTEPCRKLCPNCRKLKGITND